MKTTLSLCIWLFMVPFTLSAQTKHAFIVAISDYPRQTGWPVINSQNDVPLIEQILRAQQFKDTVVLRDQQADRASIVNEFRRLINRVQKGDKVFIHFSTHGQQITDQNGDEADGVDEAIVSYGAPISAAGQFVNYTGDMHLRDEDLGALIDELRAKLGADGDVLLVVDACNSGTITRGQAKVRGTNTVLKLPKQKVPVAKSNKSKSSRPKSPHPFMVSTRPVSQSGLAPYVAISAARANESNSECYLPDNKTPVGSLTYALNQAMRNPRRGESYRDLFSRVQSIMKQKVPGQTPEIEGDIDRELLGGKVVEQEEYATISDLQDEGRTATINAGQMTGTFAGAILKICPTGTRDLKACTSPIASATVVQAGLYSSTIQLSRALSPAKLSNYWAFTQERSFGSLVVSVGFDFRDNSLKQQAIAELNKQKLVRLTDTPDLILFQDSLNVAKIGIRRATNGFLFAKPVLIQTPADWKQIIQSLQQYVQSQFLLRLDAAGYDMDVTMELVPLKPDAKVPSDTTTSKMPFMDGNWLSFSHLDKERTAIKLTNRGSRTLYYNIIDIQPDGVVNMIVPRMENGRPVGEEPRQLIIPPGKTVLAPVTISFTPPYGEETFKLFVTAEPIDLRTVVGTAKQRGSTQSRGSMNNLVGLFDDTNEVLEKGVGTRGTESAGLPDDGNLTTQELQFKIIKSRK